MGWFLFKRVGAYSFTLVVLYAWPRQEVQYLKICKRNKSNTKRWGGICRSSTVLNVSNRAPILGRVLIYYPRDSAE